jgi:anti-anti-sigma factor
VQIEIQATGDDITIVRLLGDMDLYNSGPLKEKMLSLWAIGARKLILDLSGLRYIDSSGIGVLLYVFSSSQKRKVHVYFANVSGSVLRVITLTKLTGFLPIVKSIEDAEARLRRVEFDLEPAEPVRALRVDGADPLFDDAGMYNKTFNIDFSQIRRLSALIAQQAPPEIQEINILEQQISEIIKNAVKHGNRGDKQRGVTVSFSFSPTHAQLIVEDEGNGFQQLEEWNEFYRRKIECYQRQDFDEMMNYLAFRTELSDEADGGNAMFAAVEYWNAGVVYNKQRNKVAVRRNFT